jgi:membrane associated rhomboid family serine protease
VAEHCYRHPNRETGVSCSNCERPICPECMTSTPVGMRCPECARQRTRVATAATIGSRGGEPIATYALLGLNVIVFLAEILSGGGGAASVEGGGSLLLDGGTCGNAVSDGGPCAIRGVGVVVSDGGELFRLITGGFLHAGPLHILLNMFALYIVGTLIEPIIGTARFLGIYFAALLLGSFGALLMTDPTQITVGASGAVYGLMGAAFVIARHRGIDQIASQIGLFVVLNLVFTFSVPGISIGGHIGGLVGGAVAALLLEQIPKRIRGSARVPAEIAAIVVIVGLSIAGALWAAGQSSQVIG